MENTKLNDKRVIFGWAMFDWANSAFALVITAAIFPSYFLSITDSEIKISSDLSISNSSLYAFALSSAYLVIVFLAPMLSGIADYGGKKKFFLRLFTTLGSLACMLLFFFRSMDTLVLGTVAFIVGMIGFAGSLVFYNAYLPEIVTEEYYDSVSAKGYAYGYIGSVILLLINLLMIQKYEWFGFKESIQAVPVSFILVGLWWMGFSQLTFNCLPNSKNAAKMDNFWRKGYEEIRKVWRQVQTQPNIKRFLLSFFCYSAGVQTVIFMAATFAEKELHFETSEMIIIALILQMVGVVGALFFAWLSNKIGNKWALITTICIWTAICVMAYNVKTKTEFYVVAALVGFVMGGVQSLSRATYAKLLPENTTEITSYFSFYDVLEKLAIVIGTFSFGFIEQISGGMRNSTLTLGIYFLIGLVLLSRVKIVRA